MYSAELKDLLDEWKESYITWDKNSPSRYAFDLLVRKSNIAVIDHWNDVLMIIRANVESSKEYELRIDMLALVEYLLQQESLHSTIVYYSKLIIKWILIPSIIWKVGKPNIKIRKAAIICMLKILECKLIEQDKLKKLFKKIMA